MVESSGKARSGAVRNVVAAVIVHRGKVLLAWRAKGLSPETTNRWEFPGGKVEENEALGDAVVREVKEELFLDIAVKSLLHQQVNSYSSGNSYRVWFFECALASFAEEHSKDFPISRDVPTVWLAPNGCPDPRSTTWSSRSSHGTTKIDVSLEDSIVV